MCDCCACRIAFYCSSHLAGSVSSSDNVLKDLQYLVATQVAHICFELQRRVAALISHPTDRSSECNYSFLKTDIEPISVLCRFNIVLTSVQYDFYVGPI